jgi:hypothetical protein
MRSRAWLVGLVATAVAVAAIFFLWPRSTSDDADDPPKTATDGSAGAGPSTTTGAGAPSLSEPAPTAADDDSAGDGESASEGDRPPLDRVRDHRGAPATHPRPHRPGDKAVYIVKAPIIAGLRKSLRPEIKRCSDEYAQDLGPDAQIQGSLEVTVRAGVLSVLDVKIEQRGVPESSGLIECARKAFAAAELRADGHEDVESHILRFPFKVPVK